MRENAHLAGVDVAGQGAPDAVVEGVAGRQYADFSVAERQHGLDGCREWCEPGPNLAGDSGGRQFQVASAAKHELRFGDRRACRSPEAIESVLADANHRKPPHVPPPALRGE